MTKQEAINKVYRHYIVSKNPLSLMTKQTRTGNVTRCMYIAVTKKRVAYCPAGLLMNGGEYKSGFENQNFLTCAPARLKHIAKFILEMQIIHDRLALFSKLSQDETRVKFGRQLCALAHREGLTIS